MQNKKPRNLKLIIKQNFGVKNICKDNKPAFLSG